MSDKVTQEEQLERKLSPLNVWALALGCIIGWGAFVMPGNTFLPNAGPAGTAIAMAVAAIVLSIIAFNYNYMIRRYPVAGGEFVYANQAFGGKHGFVCAWFLSLSYLAIVPLNATALALIGRNLLGGIFQVGFHYTVAGYDVYLGEIILALAALVLFGFLSIRGVKFSGIFQTILVLALVGGVAVVLIAALVSPEATVENLSPSFSSDVVPVAGILAVVAVAPWAFVGFDTVPQAAEEFKFSASKAKLIMICGIIFGAAVYIALTLITAAVVPEGYASWEEYIAASGELSGLASLPTFNAAYILLGNAGLVFLGIAVSGAILSGIVGFYMAASRLLFSIAREGVLPPWFGKIHPSYKTPVNALLFIMVISAVAPFFGRTALGWIVDMSSLGAAIGFGYTSFAALKFALQDKRPTIIVSGIIGGLLAIAFAVLLLVPIPGLNASLGRESYICLIIWVVLGVIFHVRAQSKARAVKEA